MSSDDVSTTDRVTVAAWVPSMSVSLTPVTVTVWAVDQLALVNVSCEALTVASVVSDDVTLTTTFVVGALLSTTVNVSVLPTTVAVATVEASVTAIEPPVSTTVRPALSSSLTRTDTMVSAAESKQSSDDASTTAKVTAATLLPSPSESLTPVTVTVWVVNQLALVNVSCAVLTVASVASPLTTEMTTSVVGWAPRATVNVSVVAASVTPVDPFDSTTLGPQKSSSTTVTVTTVSGTESKASSLVASRTAKVTVVGAVSLPVVSLMAVKVTVWTVSQFALVNVRYSGLTVNCVGAELVTENVTLVAGWASRTTVKESAVPTSVGAATVFDTVTPADWAAAARGHALSSVKNTAMKATARLGMRPLWCRVYVTDSLLARLLRTRLGVGPPRHRPPCGGRP